MKRRTFIKEIILLSAAPSIVRASVIPQHNVTTAGQRPSSGPTTLLQDSFNRADSALSLGTADVGGSWSVGGTGVYGISSNQAYNVSGTGAVAFLDAGASNGTLDVTFMIGASGFTSLVFRYTDINNFWQWLKLGSNNYLQKVEGGSASNPIGPEAGAGDGDVMRVVLNGDSIKCYRNGVQVGADQSNSFNNSATKFGVLSDDGASRFDSFLMTT